MAITFLDEQPNESSSKITYLDDPKSTQQSSSSNIDTALGTAGILGAGGLAYAANKTVVQPLLTMNKANNQLRALGDIYNISPKVSTNFIPQALQDKINSTRSEGSLLLESIKNKNNIEVSDIGKRISEINNSATQSSAELANIIKSEAPRIYKTTSDNFGKALDAIDTLAEKSGFTLSNDQFVSNVLNPVIEEAKTSGLDSKIIKQLTDARDSISGQSKILDSSGSPIGTNMKMSDAKSVISNLTKEEPYSPMSAKLRESWANFLEKETPAEIKPLYEKLNSMYKPFAEFRNFLIKLSDPKTGSIDSAGIARYLDNYVKKGTDTGIGKLMDLLGNGNELVPKIDGLSDKFGVIRGLKDTKISLGQILSDAKSSGAINLNAQQQKNLQDILNLQKAKTMASELTNISSTASSKLPLNAIGKVIGKTLGIGGKLMAGIPAGVVSGEVQKRAVGYDPGDAFQRYFDIRFGSSKTKDAEIKRLNEDYQKAQQI